MAYLLTLNMEAGHSSKALGKSKGKDIPVTGHGDP
jgi:hypothetical protein